MEYAEETGLLESIPENLRCYFDYKAFGRDMDLEGKFYYIDGDMVQIWQGVWIMTREQAQEIVNNKGFAWTVTEVVKGDAFNLIYCDWKGKEHLMYYSNGLQKVTHIQ